MRKNLPFFSVLLTFLFYISIFAGSTGKIAGIVTDAETGEGLPFANVFIDGTSLGAATDLDGNYTILNIQPGVYTIRASIVGFQKKTVTDVRVNVDFTTRLNFELNTGSIEMEAVIVRGERNPLIRPDLTNPTTAINAETILELPVDQISDVIRLQAGVTVGDDGDIHIRGGQGNEVAYTLNGISLNDPYANRRSVHLATNAVQEVSVSSGTFSSEYGNALSGVVNYVTKEGGNNYTFSLRGYAGDYVTDRTELYPNIDDFDPLNRGRMEATFGGPIPFTSNKVKVFLSGIYENFNGSLYGQRLYNPTDSYLSREGFQEDDPRKGSASDPYYFNPYLDNSEGLNTGDEAWVPMNTFTSYNFQGNLIYNISTLLKLKYEVVFSKGESKGYSRTWKFNPDGLGTSFREGLIHTLAFTHTINQSMFYTLKASINNSNSQSYLYEEIDDPRYLPSLYRLGISNTGYIAGGTSNYRSDRETTTLTFKGDFLAQIWNSHEVKFGFESRFHELNFESFSVEIGKENIDGSFGNLTNHDLLYDSTLTIIRRKPTEPSLITTYERKPMDLAIYLQDKIELVESMILNIGLRYEYFDSKAEYNPNLSEDLQDIKFGFIDRSNLDAEPKQQISPRVSISYPITDRGVIRFSYGHFYQNGSLASLYRNPLFYVTNVGTNPSFGNPNVNMQRSIQYEMGLQQQLGPNLKMEITGYYKDVRDYIFSQTVFTEYGRQYSVLTNLSYSNVRGITFRLERRRAYDDIFYATLDYTFQVAEGNRTQPSEDLFFSEAAGKQTETYLVPLGFDRQHVLNLTFGLNQPNDWTLGLISNMQAGTPYTPAFPSQIVPITFEQSSDNQIFQWGVDMKFEKYFQIGNIEWSLFLFVVNLFDTQNELSVYSSTGRALSAVEETTDANQFVSISNRIENGDPGLFGIEEIDGFYSLRPERVNRPREVRLGFSILIN